MTKGCWNCHYGIKRGKLCVDCVRMAILGAVAIIFSQVVASVFGGIFK